MKKFFLFLIFTSLAFVACGQNSIVNEVDNTSPLTINPLVNFSLFFNELTQSEKDCLMSKFQNKDEMVNFVSSDSLPNDQMSGCLSELTNFRIIQGLLISNNIQLDETEKQCIKDKMSSENFDYLGYKFGKPVFTYSISSLFCLSSASRQNFSLNFQSFIESEPILRVLPDNLDSLECIATKTDNETIMNSLDSIYINSGAFPIQILSLLPYLVECSELPSELSTAGLDINSSKCLSDKLASNFSGIGENFLLEIPQIIQDVESCSINSEELLSYFEIEIPSSNDDLEIPEELQDQVLGDDRFICLSEKLELSDVLEFLYTGTLSESVINSANECDISKEEIEDLDISELLN
ncbi:MAG: hypothetical protein FI673_03395 [SAR202 cluster bacterium]|nr:hypothetical protein [SAR202 cluster bacterium]|tara:strand:- start:1847 stop:2902 length:1056 start_codon:yes stop_codon:yes gene_type:complete